MKYYQVKNPTDERMQLDEGYDLVNNALFTEEEMKGFEVPEHIVHLHFDEIELDESETTMWFGYRWKINDMSKMSKSKNWP